MKTQSLQIYMTPGKPGITNLHDFKHLARLGHALGLGALPRAPWLSFSGKVQASAEQRWRPGSHPPLPVPGQPSIEPGRQRGSPSPGCGMEKLMPRSPLSWGRVPEPAAPAVLGDAVRLTCIGSEC